jgi:hypothetical protein
MSTNWQITLSPEAAGTSGSGCRTYRKKSQASQALAVGFVVNLIAVLLQPICLGFDIVRLKRCERDSLLEHRFLKSFCRRIRVRSSTNSTSG